MLTRSIEQDIQTYLSNKNNKILFIWGPRRSGKTTLLEKLSVQLKTPIFNFDLLSDREKFIPDLTPLQKLVAEHNVILIDEVQNYPESTLALKILHDRFHTKIIATGSSELRQKSKDFDSLAGRFDELYCVPLSINEIEENKKAKAYDRQALYKQVVNDIQIYGAYPEIYTQKKATEKINLLQKILDTYVLKDIISIYDLKNTKLAKEILLKIALQIGNEASLREIANSLSANVATVSNYIEIFIKNYILIPLPSFKTNMRRAVFENKKYFFYDEGIRNILVRDFREVHLRPDKGGVFENFIVTEIDKLKRIKRIPFEAYFYREYGGKEVDIVLEDYQKRYLCFEVKHTEKPVQPVFPLPHTFKIITPDNYFEEINNIPSYFT